MRNSQKIMKVAEERRRVILKAAAARYASGARLVAAGRSMMAKSAQILGVNRGDLVKHPVLTGSATGAIAGLIYEALRDKGENERDKSYLTRALLGALAGGAVSSAFPNHTVSAIKNVGKSIDALGQQPNGGSASTASSATTGV